MQNHATRHRYNSDQSIVQFYPEKKTWKRKLNSTEHYFSSMIVSGALYFKGKLSTDRFLSALQRTLDQFEFLYCKLHAEGDDQSISYTQDDFVQLELESRQETIDQLNADAATPQKMDPRMHAGIGVMIENLPIGVFKLTLLNDGFAIGYRLNHAFFDQSSIVYFLKCLSQNYTKGHQEAAFKQPLLADLDSIIERHPKTFKDLEDLRVQGEMLTFDKYLAPQDKYKLMSFYTIPYSGATIDLKFNYEEMSRLKQQSDQFVSENDILHALLFKINAFDPALPLDQSISLTYVCNMRKLLGYGEEVLGNVITGTALALKVGDVRSSSVLDLAKLNRKSVSEINEKLFLDNLAWYQNVRKFKENPHDYFKKCYFDPHAWIVSNWSSFKYDEISFDGAIPVALKGPIVPPQMKVNLVYFDHLDGKKRLRISAGVPRAALDEVVRLGKTTNLFECEAMS